MSAQRKPAITHSLCWLFGLSVQISQGFLVFPRGGSFGYLAALAMPLDLRNHDIYWAFNFEANYGIPSNDTYYDWIDRWNLANEFTGIGNDVTPIDGRQSRTKRAMLYTRSSFYRTFMGYLEHFQMNGTACLLRTICEVSETGLDENNGLLGSIFKILFMPTTSAPENSHEMADALYEAELQGNRGDCTQYTHSCPEGVINMISDWF